MKKHVGAFLVETLHNYVCYVMFLSLSFSSGLCVKADSSSAFRRKDWKNPPLAKLQGSQLTGKQVGTFLFINLIFKSGIIAKY